MSRIRDWIQKVGTPCPRCHEMPIYKLWRGTVTVILVVFIFAALVAGYKSAIYCVETKSINECRANGSDK